MPKRSSKPKGDANVTAFRVVEIATEAHLGEAGRGASFGKAVNGVDQEAEGGRGGGEDSSRREASKAQDQGKNPAAVALGRLGGIKGGKARAVSLTPKKRSEIARKAAKARWKAVADDD